MNKSFKKEKDGSYQLLVDDQKSGIFIHIPDSYKIEDYNIVLTGDEFKPSKRAHFTLLGAPSKMGEIKIDAGADIRFKKDINISVERFLKLGKNDNFLVDAYGSTSVSYEELEIAGNTDTTITLVKENPRPSLLEETNTTAVLSTSIKNNNYCMFDIGTEVQKFAINNNKSQTVSSVPFKLSVVGADYLFIEDNKADPNSKDSIVFVEATGGFCLENTEMEVTGKNFVRNIHQPSNSEVFPILKMRCSAIKLTRAVIEANAINFDIRGENKKTIAFEGDIKIKTDKNIAIYGENSLENIRVTCLDTSIDLHDNGLLKDSVVNFAPDTYKGKPRTISNSAFTNATITNVVYDLSLFVDRSHRNSEHIFCDNLSMRGESSQIKILLDGGTFYDAKIYMPITLENIALDAHSKLEIKVESGADDREKLSFPVKLKNIDVKKHGIFELSQGIKAQNCSFNELSYSAVLNDRDKVQELDNTICQGVVELKNLEKISCCDIENLKLSSKEGIEIGNELFKNQRISDYEAYIKQQKSNDLQESTLVTNELEVL